MKRFTPFYAFCAIILLAGCDLSKYPIDATPQVKVDNRLLGSWSEKKNEPLTIAVIVKKADEYKYTIITYDKKKKDQQVLTAFMSDVDKSSFLNVYGKNDSADGYLFLRILDINAAANKITVATVSDTMMQYLKSAPETRAYVQKHMNERSFYSDTGYLYKAK